MGNDRLKTEGRRLKAKPTHGFHRASWATAVAVVAVALVMTSCTTTPTKISQLASATHKAFITYRQYAEAPDPGESVGSTGATPDGAGGGSPRLTKQYHDLGNQIESALAEINAWASSTSPEVYAGYPSDYNGPRMGEH